MSRDSAKRIRALARHNRKTPTEAEAKLWRFLRNRHIVDCKFRRQHKISRYIVDFGCIEKNLIVELDGGHHIEEEQCQRDAARTAALNSLGFKVLRFWNHQILREFDSVWWAIRNALEGFPEEEKQKRLE